MPLQSKYLREEDAKRDQQPLSSAPQSGGLSSPRPFWPSDEIFMRRVNNQKPTGGGGGGASTQSIYTSIVAHSQHKAGGAPMVKMKGKFQPVLQKRSLEHILFDDNYTRYINTQTS